MYTGIRKNVTS